MLTNPSRSFEWYYHQNWWNLLFRHWYTVTYNLHIFHDSSKHLAYYATLQATKWSYSPMIYHQIDGTSLLSLMDYITHNLPVFHDSSKHWLTIIYFKPPTEATVQSDLTSNHHLHAHMLSTPTMSMWLKTFCMHALLSIPQPPTWFNILHAYQGLYLLTVYNQEQVGFKKRWQIKILSSIRVSTPQQPLES